MIKNIKQNMRMRATTNILIILMMLAWAGCVGGKSGGHENAGGSNTEQQEQPPLYPVFSLYDSTGREGYQLYKNDSRLASINIPAGRKVLSMRAFKSDCYLLLSEFCADSASTLPAEIYKNGRPAMQFDPSFMACDMDIDGGHFYVLGRDTKSKSVVVYRDGINVLEVPESQYSRPCKVGVFNQDIYVVFQTADSAIVTKGGNNRVVAFKGQCRDFKVSHMGYYTIVDSSLYSNKERIMRDEYYRNGDREMFAIPTTVTLSNTDCYVGCQSYIDKTKYYACVFKNKGALITLKPDSKRIGESDLQTYCAGVATCPAGNYAAYYRMDADGKPLKPVVFRYLFETTESFGIDFGDNAARLLLMASSR